MKDIAKSVLLATLLLMLSPFVQASVQLHLGLYTTHVMSNNEAYNNDNKLIAVEWDNIVVGNMINSHNNNSNLVAYDVSFLENSVGVYLGVVSGYGGDVSYKEHIPLIAPYYKWKCLQLAMLGEAINLSVNFQLD